MTLLTIDGERVHAVEMAGEYVFLGKRQPAHSILVLSGPQRRVLPDRRHIARCGYTVIAGASLSTGNA